MREYRVNLPAIYAFITDALRCRQREGLLDNRVELRQASPLNTFFTVISFACDFVNWRDQVTRALALAPGPVLLNSE